MLTESATAQIEIPIPVVEITPAEGVEVFRGLTVVADNVTDKRFEYIWLYGGTSEGH